MKKHFKLLLTIAGFSFLFLNMISSQDIKDNEYYKKAVEVFSDAKTEFEKGDYDKGYELSEEARNLLDKANQDNLLKIYILRIEALKKEAQSKIDYARSGGAEKNEGFLKTLNKALELFGSGDQKYTDGKNKNEFKEKSGLFAEAIDLFTEANRWAKQVLLDMFPEGKIEKAADNAVDQNKEDAKKLLAEAQKKLTETKENVEEIKYTDKLREADGMLSDAKRLYEEDNYKSSIDKSKELLALLDTFEYSIVFPRYYTVVLIPNRRDCFWRIAEKDFIYNNGYKWTVIYRKNKERLRFPNNPNLIHPTIVVEIPSLNGEIRKGMYDPKKTYPKFDPKKDYTKK